ncbi:MAG: 16S rRNA (uracil(1498)-N(3))-methyltransferase [Spirochaetaceae bacterium]|jgi:RsmE family RNA methyltransferase|nr:16S rRNA (uracil(1498)-N(3))-methyltransferase [Spirochaetaceae bacterium]
MNIILFEESEIHAPLPKHDPRTVHLIKTLHKKEGDEFCAGLLGGNRGKGKIEHLRQDGSLVFSLELTDQPLRRLPLHAGVGFPRPIQLRRILRELSNMGLAEISLFGTDLGEKSYRSTNLLEDGGARLALIEGAVQSRDTSLPLLNFYRNVDEWLRKRIEPLGTQISGVPFSAPCLILADNTPCALSCTELPIREESFVIAIGSERGWSDRERRLFEKASFKSFSLGERALRTETACVAAAALIMNRIG